MHTHAHPAVPAYATMRRLSTASIFSVHGQSSPSLSVYVTEVVEPSKDTVCYCWKISKRSIIFFCWKTGRQETGSYWLVWTIQARLHFVLLMSVNVISYTTMTSCTHFQVVCLRWVKYHMKNSFPSIRLWLHGWSTNTFEPIPEKWLGHEGKTDRWWCRKCDQC